MNTKATKNMWVTRCEHIGALTGGILSLIFGWISKLYDSAKKDSSITFLIGMIIFAVGLCWYTMDDITSRNRPASIESIKEFVQKENVECRTRLITDKINNMTSSITNADLTSLGLYCKNEVETKNQKQLLQELKK